MPAIIHMRKGGDPGELLEVEDRRNQLYYQKEYQAELAYLLPRMLHLGYFEQLC